MGDGLGKDKKGRIEPVPVVVLPPGKSLDHCMKIKEKKLGISVSFAMLSWKSMQSLSNMDPINVGTGCNQGGDSQTFLVEFTFTKNLQTEFEFFIFNFASSSPVIFYRVRVWFE